MCKPHWRAYTNALRKAALARKAETPEPEPEVVGPDETPEPEAPAPRKTRRPGQAEPGRSTPRSYPHRHTTGPGRESGACLRPVGSGHHRSGQRRPRWPCGVRPWAIHGEEARVT